MFVQQARIVLEMPFLTRSALKADGMFKCSVNKHIAYSCNPDKEASSNSLWSSAQACGHTDLIGKSSMVSVESGDTDHIDESIMVPVECSIKPHTVRFTDF